MAIINPADLSFNGDEIKALSEAVFESGFSKPELSKFHTVVTGVAVNKQIAILGRLNGLVGKGSGECSPTSSTATVSMSEKTWVPKMVSDRLSACWTDLQETFFVYGLKVGVAKADLTSTDFFNFIQDLLSDAMQELVYRLAWFNDVDADDVDGTGVLTSGTDLAFFNKLNGLFQQMFEVVGAVPARLTSGLGTRNGGASYVLQQFVEADVTNRVVTKMLRRLKVNADLRLRGKADLIYIVTQSVADQYEAELEDMNSAYTTDKIENGITILKKGSITVIAFDFWDRIIAEYYDDGTTLFLPHRAILATPSNLQIKIENEGSLSEMAVIYDPILKKNHIDFAFMFDAKLVEDHLFQIAY